MFFSKFSFVFYIGNEYVALYNSLRMKPVYLKKSDFNKIKKIIDKKNQPTDELKFIIDELIKYKVLVKKGDDKKILDFVKSVIPEPQVNVCYFILSEQCNLACKYCFLGNNDEEKRTQFKKENMSKKIALNGIYFFIKQLEMNKFDENLKPTVYFMVGNLF